MNLLHDETTLDRPTNGRPREEGPAPDRREVRYEHSLSLAPLLEHLGITLLIATYQAGTLVVVGSEEGKFALALHNLERAMGLAVRPDQIALSTTSQVWYLRAAPNIAPRIEPAAPHNGCHLNGLAMGNGRPRNVTAQLSLKASKPWRPRASCDCATRTPSPPGLP